MKNVMVLFALFTFFLVSCAVQQSKPLPPEELISEVNIMELTSPAFQQEEPIPAKYTCDGENINPPLLISGVPKSAKSLILIMDDPDIPAEAKRNLNVEVWDHWVMFNMPPTLSTIEENSQPPGVAGINTRKLLGYRGPCPPDKEHRYFFRLYALDMMLSLQEGATRKEVEQAMQGHILEEAVLMGRYERKVS